MRRIAAAGLLATLLVACVSPLKEQPRLSRFVGTDHPFASEAVYFIVTDRFVDGDPSNNYPQQGGEWHSFDREITSPEGYKANIGYLGGDFRGVLDHADYIAEMGFTSVWLTPVVDNPDEAFSGGVAVGEGFPADHGKTGYHGYWGVNFFALDEHLISADLDYAGLDAGLEAKGLGLVLDVVCNHGSPSFDMPSDQPKFGELYDASGQLVADHQNLEPEALVDDERLHAMYRRDRDIGQLSNLDDESPRVLEYCASATMKWLDQGADAIRIDTIKHMPDAFWAAYAARLRESHPGLFMFAEHWSYEAKDVSRHTFPENGNISVLDFPLQRAMSQVFGQSNQGYEVLATPLHLNDGMYYNPYELMSFYDNHDMSRLDADANGFIDANNWLFTARGIPVVYYGSESAFRAGRGEHAGNRDFFGAARVEQAREHPIRRQLINIAERRKALPALQRGLQHNVMLEGDQAAFLRVLQHDDLSQSVLVLLNKSDADSEVRVDTGLPDVVWRADDASTVWRVSGDSIVSATVPAHGVVLLISDDPVTHGASFDALARVTATGSTDD
ncbi:MAG: alpha-amylase family glycosyl hydrolase [Pseudomonadota bacterium]